MKFNVTICYMCAVGILMHLIVIITDSTRWFSVLYVEAGAINIVSMIRALRFQTPMENFRADYFVTRELTMPSKIINCSKL